MLPDPNNLFRESYSHSDLTIDNIEV